MTADPLLTLARPDLADVRLQGRVRAAAYLPTRPMHCRVPAAALRAAPSAAAEQRDQLLHGEGFEVLERAGGWAWGQACRDGYVGYVAEAALGEGAAEATHRVAALRAYAFIEPDLRSPHHGLFSLNALVRVGNREGRFVESDAGWFVEAQLAPLGVFETDPAGVAERFAGAPYQWGGRESLGLDCSGLVQQALHACGLACPRDTDMQQAALGQDVDSRMLARGDLVFWDGHVGIMRDAALLLHASGDFAAVVSEPLAEAVGRLGAQGRLPTAYRRL